MIMNLTSQSSTLLVAGEEGAVIMTDKVFKCCKVPQNHAKGML